MVDSGRERIRLIALCMLVFWLVVPLAKSTVEGRLASELSEPMQVGPLALGAIASAVLLGLARSKRVRSELLLQSALVYEVVTSLAFALAQYWGTFAQMDASDMNFDTVGASIVAPWMLLFTVLVPVRPRFAAVALAASGVTLGLVYTVNMYRGEAPALEPMQAFFVLVFPYAMVGIAAWLAARTIYQLGRDLRATQQMGSYKLERLLGEGGMGQVWVASHSMLARPAAVKLIRADAVGDDPQQVMVATERFRREVEATANLMSPHTVDVYDFGATDSGELFYVMELLDGVDLGALIETHGPIEPERVVHILRQCCRSLSEAHSKGLVHRDIKPTNIFLCRYGLEHDFAKVLDFGLVKEMTHTDPALSQVGTFAGTPAFMPPEAAKGVPTDGRADLYALGCVAYWLLTGQLLFEGDSPLAMAIAHLNQAPEPPSHRAEVPVPPELDEVVLRCLEKEPADRPADALALDALLAAIPTEVAWDAKRADAWWSAHRPAHADGARHIL